MRRGEAPVAHLFLLRSLLPPRFIASSDTHGACKEVLGRKEGEGPSGGAGSLPPKRGRGRPRKHAATPAVAPRGRGGASTRGGSRPGHGSPVDEGRRAMVARPPRSRFHSVEVLPEFVVWSENLAST